MDTVSLSPAQAEIIAAAIVPDIKRYIAEHQAEYEAFLVKWNEQHGEGIA